MFRVSVSDSSYVNSNLCGSYVEVQLKVTVKLSLCLTKHYAMKTYGGMDV
jgi:hypothetical protein